MLHKVKSPRDHPGNGPEMFERIPEEALSGGAEYCDVRLEHRRGVSMEFKDGEPREAVPGDEQGICVRVLFGGAWGLASSNDLSRAGLKRTASAALQIARARSSLQKARDRDRLAPVKATPPGHLW